MFEEYNIKGKWDSELEEFCFPLDEIVQKVTDFENIEDFCQKIEKQKGIEVSVPLKDGVEVIGAKDLFRVVQDIPSSNAEPIKLWLAEAGKDRIYEIHDPELIIIDAIDNYRKRGKSEEWITQKLKSIYKKNNLLSYFDMENPI